jgi:hypothetical protein
MDTLNKLYALAKNVADCVVPQGKYVCHENCAVPAILLMLRVSWFVLCRRIWNDDSRETKRRCKNMPWLVGKDQV